MAVHFLLYNRHPLTSAMVARDLGYNSPTQKIQVIALAFFATAGLALAGLAVPATCAALALVVSILIPIIPFRSSESEVYGAEPELVRDPSMRRAEGFAEPLSDASARPLLNALLRSMETTRVGHRAAAVLC